MFIAGIELFFGFIAGAILLAIGIFAIWKGPSLLWRGAKKLNEWIVVIPRVWRITAILVPVFLGVELQQDWLGLGGAVFVAIYFLNRVIWELREGSAWVRRFCAIATGICFVLVIGIIVWEMLMVR